MISAIGPTGTQRMTDMIRTSGTKPGTVAVKTDAADGSAQATPAALLAAEGAPIDSDKVASIKTAIANGTYSIDPRAIADKMIETDLPA